MRRKLIIFAPLAVGGLLLFAALGGEVVKLLWNWLMPALFGWPQVTFWQALALLALCRILFGGFGPRAMSGPRSGIRRRMAERWEQMTPEERARFRQGMRERWGFGPRASDGKAD
jgi:hypothetical protein